MVALRALLLEDGIEKASAVLNGHGSNGIGRLAKLFGTAGKDGETFEGCNEIREYGTNGVGLVRAAVRQGYCDRGIFKRADIGKELMPTLGKLNLLRVLRVASDENARRTSPPFLCIRIRLKL